ncbi:hypothetical protein FPG87_13315 [Flavobacterium psychrophilum]|nr:hypothetical protein FPG87_13315 [Flavobacterium psychrophilum]
MTLGLYLNFRYLKGIEVEKNTEMILNYQVLEFWCHNSSKMTDKMTVKFNGKSYNVALYGGECSDIEKGIIRPKLYYMKEKDVVFYKGQYLPFPYVYLTYIAAFLLPFFGFIVYRKELDNHYSTM